MINIIKLYVIVIIWAGGIFLIYMPKPEGHRLKGADIDIRQIPSAHVITDIYLLRYFNKNWTNLMKTIAQLLYILWVLDFDCEF